MLVGAAASVATPVPPLPVTPAVTLTLSKVDVLSVLVATLQTTRPTSALLMMLSVVLPIVLQLLPSAEAAAVTVVPLRIRRTQAGGVWLAVPRYVAAAPVLGRVVNSE